MFSFMVRFFSRASEIALSGNFPYWLDTVLEASRFIKHRISRRLIPFYFFGLLNYGKAVAALSMLSDVTCFHVLILYLNLYVLLRVAEAGGLASLDGATIGLVRILESWSITFRIRERQSHTVCALASCRPRHPHL
jgi:hypothetical protein